MDIVIDPEFSALIPPLHPEERRELEANLMESGGPRDPLVVWNQGGSLTILDGHNRYGICIERGLTFTVTEIEIADRDEARRWIERNQLGRRNLPRESYAIILGRLYNATKLKKGGQTKETKGRGKTRERLGREHGLDERTVEKAGKFQAAAVKLGVESDVASGRMRVPQYRLIAAAKTLPDSPTPEEAREAIRKAMQAPAKKCGRDPPKAKGWLVPADPSDCLKAIDFYARSFIWRSPESLGALSSVLSRLIEETTRHAEELMGISGRGE